jgi:hypothetical protein
MKNIYAKSDGNGGINISKTMIAFFGLFITCIITLSSVAAYAAGLSSEVIHNKEEIMRMQEEMMRKDVATEKLNAICERLISIEKKIDLMGNN